MSTFNTAILNTLVSYAIKGAGFVNDLELSSYIGIKIADGKINFNTTDGTQYTRVSADCSADDFDVVVEAETFAKLISKINSDTVDIEIVDDNLVIKGNGKYTLGIKPDENGNPLSFPDKFPATVTEIGKLTTADIAIVGSAIKASLSSVVDSVTSNYYFGDIIASTDRAMLSVYDCKVFDEPYLFNKKFVELFSMPGTDVTISKSDTMLVANSDIGDVGSLSVCTRLNTDVSNFNVAGINKFLALEVGSFCRFRKAQMLDLLDRMALFVSKFDDGAITLNFTADSIEVSSLTNDGVESVEITECKNQQDMSITINIDRLRNQLKSYNSDVVDLYYGSDICIKLVDGNITQIIALIKK